MRKGDFIQTRAGGELFVRDWGSGRPVLLLAGWATTSDLWGPLMLQLNAAGLRTIAYDRRGHGRSSDAGAMDYDLLADDLADVLAALNLKDCIVVAHSAAGGEVARYVSRHGADRLAHLMLVGTVLPTLLRSTSNPDGLEPDLFMATLRRLETDLPAWIDENAEAFAPGAPKRTLDWVAAMVMGCSHRAIVDFQRWAAAADFTDELRSLSLPTTVICGDRDVSAPLELFSRRVAGLLTRAELVVYEDAAHGLMLTHTERLAQDIALRADCGGIRRAA